MFRYIIKRLLIMIPTLLITSLLIFWAMDLAGGDPVNQILPENASVAQREAMRQEMGFNDPFIIRYLRYMEGIVTGDMGKSYISGQEVFKTFMGRLHMTLLLGGVALIFACLISIPLGIYTALHENTWKDTAATILALFGVSMPNFWLGLMLILLFSLKLGLLPSGGTGGIRYLILPSVTVGLSLAALLTRTTRSAMLDVVRQDYMTTAKAKGASYQRVIYNHGLRNAMIPIVTAIGMQFSYVMTGSALAETVFGWPGIGRLVVDSINKRDTPMVTGSIILCCVLMAVINLVVDIIYAFCDPRIKAQYSAKG
jgi:peptide/nickel transport system permease protein